MKSEEYCTFTLRNMRIDFPVYKDRETTERIVREIEDRLVRMEAASRTIDTQKFAVLTAYEFAVERHALEEEHEEDSRDLVKALELLTRQLKDVVTRFQIGAVPENDE